MGYRGIGVSGNRSWSVLGVPGGGKTLGLSVSITGPGRGLVLCVLEGDRVVGG